MSLILVLGGTRSGKSSFAENLVDKLSDNVAYLATAQSLDCEMEERINLHKKRRPDNWTTYEESFNIPPIINNIKNKHNVILLDCITMLVSNLLLKDLDFEKINTEKLMEKEKYVLEEIEKMIECIVEDEECTLVVVSSEVGLGLVPSDKISRVYRDINGKCNQLLAEKASKVFVVWAGLPIQIKPNLEKVFFD